MAEKNVNLDYYSLSARFVFDSWLFPGRFYLACKVLAPQLSVDRSVNRGKSELRLKPEA